MAVSGKKMPIYKKILREQIKKWMVKEFLEYRLLRLGYVDSNVVRTPLGTRIVIFAERPSRIIGRRGAIAKELSQLLETKLGVENPQIDVTDISRVEAPELFPRVIALRIANAMARGVRFRRAAFVAMRQIQEAGAKGYEIVISGKLTTERAKFEKYTVGKIYKSGNDSVVNVRRAVLPALLKPGIYGIEVSITSPTTRLSDEFSIRPAVRPEAAPEVTANE